MAIRRRALPGWRWICANSGWPLHGPSWAGGCGYAGHAVNPSMGARRKHPCFLRSRIPAPADPRRCVGGHGTSKAGFDVFHALPAVELFGAEVWKPTLPPLSMTSAAVGSVVRRLPGSHPHAITHDPETKTLSLLPLATSHPSKVGRSGFAGLSKTWMFLPSLICSESGSVGAESRRGPPCKPGSRRSPWSLAPTPESPLIRPNSCWS